MTQYMIKKVSELNKDMARFSIYGIHGTATAGQTTNIDWQVPAEFWMEGGKVVLKGHVNGDRLWMQIVDKDNIFGLGVEYVLGEHVTNIAVAADSESQGEVLCPYIALIAAGLYIRLIYLSTGQNNVSVSLNLRRHIPQG